MVYEICDNGTSYVHELPALPSSQTPPPTTFELTSLPKKIIFTRAGTVLALEAGTNQACSIGGLSVTPWPIGANTRCVWCTTEGGLFTCDAEMHCRVIPLPSTAQSEHFSGRGVVVDDTLLAYYGGAMLRVDGKTGSITPIASFNRAFPDAIRARWSSTRVCYCLDAKYCIFSFAIGKGQRDQLLRYDYVADHWEDLGESEHKNTKFDQITTSHGVIDPSYDSNILFRGEEQGFQPAWNLPFHSRVWSLLAGTNTYLYFHTPLGIFRLRWDELSQASAQMEGK